MDGRVFLILAITCIQGFLAAPLNSSGESPKNDVTTGPLTSEEEAKIGQELKKLRDQGELLKMEMRKFSGAFPGLDKMTDLLVSSVNNQAESFVNFNKDRLNDPQRQTKDTRFRKSFDVLKTLEKGFISELQSKFGASGNGAASPTKRSPRGVRRPSSGFRTWSGPTERTGP